MNPTLEEIRNAVSIGQTNVEELVQKAVQEGVEAKEILEKGLIAGLDSIGRLWKDGEAYLPEVLMAASVMKKGMEIIKKKLVSSSVRPKGKVVIGTVKGDVHDIGKSLVAMMMETFGFEVSDLGVDVAPERFVQTARSQQAEIVCMSALLSTALLQLKNTVEHVKKSRLNVVTMVGGAPVTQEYSDSIGADGYAPDAVLAVDKAGELLRRRIK